MSSATEKMKSARRVSIRLYPRRAATLLEVLILCAFLALMLVTMAGVVRQFYRSRTSMADRDLESQALLQLMAELRRDVAGCFDVVQTSPDLVVRCLDSADGGRLPASFPDPAPSPSPAWDPAQGLMTVRYTHDSLHSLLWREASFGDGRTSRQRLAEGIQGFLVTSAAPQELEIQFSWRGSGSLQTHQIRMHRVDR